MVLSAAFALSAFEDRFKMIPFASLIAIMAMGAGMKKWGSGLSRILSEKYDKMWVNYVGKKRKQEFEEKTKDTDSVANDFFNMFFGNVKEEKKDINISGILIPWLLVIFGGFIYIS